MATLPLTSPGAPTATATATTQIAYGTPPFNLTLTLFPSPTSIVFSAASFPGSTITQGALTIKPPGTSTWNGISITVPENGATVIIGTVPYTLFPNGDVKPPTAISPSPTPSSTLATPTAISPSLIPSSALAPPTTQENMSAQPSMASSNASTTSPSSASYSSPAIPAIPTQPTSTHTPSTAKSSGVSSGAAAGIAIGCLIAGALVASFIAWYFPGRGRRHRRRRDHEATALAMIDRRGITPTTAAQTRSLKSGGGTVALNLEGGLPQPLEDKAIADEITKISSSIKNHVHSYYHTQRVSSGLLDLNDLQRLGGGLPVSIDTLSTLLNNSDTRDIALRFCIAWVAVSRMHVYGNSTTSFLPPEIASCVKSMFLIENGTQCEYLCVLVLNLSTNARIAQAALLAKWRVLSAHLLRSKYTSYSVSPSDSRSASIEDALRALDGILLPYVDSRMDTNQRRRNLEEILRRAASFAFVLFSQPSTWNFDWGEKQSVRSGSLCVFPSLVQTIDEHGEPLRPPRVVSEAVV
jgi:hypothetical protein